MFYVSGIIIAFFLAAILFSKKNKTSSDKILSFWLLLLGAHLFLFYLNFSGQVYEWPFLLGVEIPLPLLHPPFLYLYTAALSDPRPIRSKRWMIHFLPVLACYVYLIHFFSLSAAQKTAVYQNEGAGYELFTFVNLSAIHISGIFYIVLSGLLLRKHSKNIHNLFSYEEKINLKWLRYLIGGIAAIWLAVFTASDPVVFAAVVLFVLFIGNFGIRQVGIFTNRPSFQLQPVLSSPVSRNVLPDWEVPKHNVLSPENGPDNEALPALEPDKRKYQKSGLTAATAEALHQDLQHLMETEKIFKESELSLTQLAERLKTHPNYLSQIINEKEGKNFFDYINTRRIEAFLTLTSDPKNRRFTLLALALDCGFNSKSSFIRYFKKVTGQSPSQYVSTATKMSRKGAKI